MNAQTKQPAQGSASAHRALVLIPSYNTGALVVQTVAAARAQWQPVWVVIDGSTDGSERALRDRFADDSDVTILRLTANSGKGSALLVGMEKALELGYTHVLTMDADGQHPAELIRPFMSSSRAQAGAMILGVPVFGTDAPTLRTNGRKISNWWANLETLWAGVDDSLFGFRVYPIALLVNIMHKHRWMRRFDFDVEAVVRLYWRGVQPISLCAPVRYLSAEEGGVSHFNYVRDNVLLTWMHMRLFAEFLVRLPWLLFRRNRY